MSSINALIEECKKQFPENPPVLKAVHQALEAQAEKAQKFTAPKENKTEASQEGESEWIKNYLFKSNIARGIY